MQNSSRDGNVNRCINFNTIEALHTSGDFMRLRDLTRRCVRSWMSCDEASWRLFDLRSMACDCCLMRWCDPLEAFGFSPALRVSPSATSPVGS